MMTSDHNAFTRRVTEAIHHASRFGIIITHFTSEVPMRKMSVRADDVGAFSDTFGTYYFNFAPARFDHRSDSEKASSL